MTTESLITLVFAAGLGLFLTLAYAAADKPPLRYLVYAAVGLADVIGLLTGAAWSLVLFFNVDVAVPPAGPDGGPNMEPVVGAIAGMGPIIATLSIVGLLLMFEPFRRLLARVMPIDPRSLVHLVAVHYGLGVVAIGALIGATMASANQDPKLLASLK